MVSQIHRELEVDTFTWALFQRPLGEALHKFVVLKQARHCERRETDMQEKPADRHVLEVDTIWHATTGTMKFTENQTGV